LRFTGSLKTCTNDDYIVSKKEEIVNEVAGKIEEYESANSTFFDEINSYSDLFTIKRPPKKVGTFSRPRTPETFRAVNALGTMMYRMITAQDPFFSCVSMDPANSESSLYKIEKTIQMQLRISQYKRYLLKALMQTALMGVSVVEEAFEWVTVNQLGRRIPLTNFIPRSLLQVGFDRNAFDIDKSDWLYTNDRITPYALRRMAENDAGGGIWSRGDIQKAIDEKGGETTNTHVLDRIATEGSDTSESNAVSGHMELSMYYGKLDTMNDGVEYVCGLVNRKHLVRFHENKDQSGHRNFRIGRWIEWELMPIGPGIGKLLSGHQKSIDANRAKVETGITFNNLNMWLKDRGAGINSQAFKLIPLRIIEGDGINSIKPLETTGVGIVQGLKLDEILKQEFRVASGATDTLQAIMTNGTLGEVSIAQNEAVRNISVKAELIAESFSRQHLEQMHTNNYSCVGEKFVISGTKKPTIVYPEDLKVDVDFVITMSTDKNFRPERNKDLVQVAQILTSIRNNELSEVAKPFVMELAKGMDVDPKAVEQAYQTQAANQQAMMEQAAMQAIQKMLVQMAKEQGKAQPVEQPGGTAAVPVSGPDVEGSVNQPVEAM
jgi:hypothetical protein